MIRFIFRCSYLLSSLIKAPTIDSRFPRPAPGIRMEGGRELGEMKCFFLMFFNLLTHPHLPQPYPSHNPAPCSHHLINPSTAFMNSLQTSTAASISISIAGTSSEYCVSCLASRRASRLSRKSTFKNPLTTYFSSM